MEQKLFKPGQIVQWAVLDTAMKFAVSEYGDGPFTVFAVEEVPSKDRGEVPDDVPGEPEHDSTESVGHPQWVILDDGTGHALMCDFLGKKEICKISGLYFKVV